MKPVHALLPRVCIASGAALIALGFCAMKPDGSAVAVYLAGVALASFGLGSRKRRW